VDDPVGIGRLCNIREPREVPFLSEAENGGVVAGSRLLLAKLQGEGNAWAEAGLIAERLVVEPK
jgi:hypothetical protein